MLLESKECAVKPDSHGRRIALGSSCRKFKYEFFLAGWEKIFQSLIGICVFFIGSHSTVLSNISNAYL